MKNTINTTMFTIRFRAHEAIECYRTLRTSERLVHGKWIRLSRKQALVEAALSLFAR